MQRLQRPRTDRKASCGLACDEDDAGCDTTIGGSLFQSSLAFAIDFRGRFVQAAGLSSVTAENCTDAAREIGRPEMHEDHVVCTFVPLGEAHWRMCGPHVCGCASGTVDMACTGTICSPHWPLRRHQHPTAETHQMPRTWGRQTRRPARPRARAVAAGATWRHRASWRQRCASEQCRT